MNNNDTNLNGVGGTTPNPAGFSPNPDNGMNPNGMANPQDGLQGISLGNMNMGAQPSGTIDPVAPPVQPPMQNSFQDVNSGSINPMMNQPSSAAPIMNPSSVGPSPMDGSNLNMSATGMTFPNSGNPMNVGTDSGFQQAPGTFDSSVPPLGQNSPTSMDGMGMNMGQPNFGGTPMNSSFDNGANGAMNGFGQPMGGVNSFPQTTPGMDMNNGMNPMGGPNMIGAVPTPPVMGPQNGKKKKEKKPMSKTTLILLVVLLILIIGCGVYFILNGSKNAAPKVSIVANDVILDLGKPLSTDVSDFATVTGYDVNSCTLDTKDVDLTRMGSYQYTVTCGTMSKTGTVVLQDNIAPIVSVREVNVVPGTVVKLEDFISACEDYTTCTYELLNSTQSLDTLTEVEGTYSVDIVVSDDYDNQTKVTATLVVSSSAPVKYMFCTPTTLPSSTLDADLSVSYNYGISVEDTLSRTQKISTYTFSDELEYMTIKNSYTPTTGIAGLVGEVEFDDVNFVITLTQVITEDELATEFNVSPFPTTYDELKEFHINQGISCKNR